MESSAANQFYKKLTLSLISITLIGVILIYGKEIIIPLLIAILLANLLLPVVNFLMNKGLMRPVSILLPLIGAVIVIGGIVFFLSSQIGNFFEDLPALKERLSEVGTSFQTWVRENTNITIRKQNQYIVQAMDNLKKQGPEILGTTIASITDILMYIVLIPLYTFLVLYYKGTIKTFLIATFQNGSEKKVTEVLHESTTMAQQYITGLMIETVIVFTLNVIGFLILGIKYVVFLSLLVALLNLIPYVGILVANFLCMLITLVSSDNISDVVWVGIILAIVQFIDNNFGVPLVVGNKVRINALVTIVGVFVGGALCGIPGMFLAIPGLAVLKIIFDKVPDLKPWGVLLGDESSSGKPLRLFHSKKVSKTN